MGDFEACRLISLVQGELSCGAVLIHLSVDDQLTSAVADVEVGLEGESAAVEVDGLADAQGAGLCGNTSRTIEVVPSDGE